MNRKLLLLLPLLCVAFVGAAEGKIGQFNIYDTSTWFSIAVIIVIIHLTLVALAYMLAGMFQDEELKAWCKNEVIQAVYSIVIIVSLGGLLLLLDSTTNQFFVGIVNPQAVCENDSKCHQLRTDLFFDMSTNRWKEGGAGTKGTHIWLGGNNNIVCETTGSDQQLPCDPKFLMARSYLGITYEKLAVLLGNEMYSYAVYNAVDSYSFSTGFSFLAKSFGLTFFSGFPVHSVLLNTIGHMIIFTEKLMMLIKFQESVLKFFEYGLAAALILLGLFFRSIWIFRRAGGLFLAMGICFMFVLPLLYSLGWYTIDIPPLREAGISKEASPVTQPKSDILLNVASGLNIINSFIAALTSSNVGSAIAIFTTLVGFAVLRGFELSLLITTPPGMIKMGLDVFVIFSAILTMFQLSLVPIQDADNLYTDYSKNVAQPGYFDLLSRYALVAVAIPLLNFYILFSFIRGLSPMLGGEAEIPALSRLL